MDEKEPTQRTEQGHEIPVPRRSAWDRLLHKAAHPGPAEDTEDPDPFSLIVEDSEPVPVAEETEERKRAIEKDFWTKK